MLSHYPNTPRSNNNNQKNIIMHQEKIITAGKKNKRGVAAYHVLIRGGSAEDIHHCPPTFM